MNSKKLWTAFAVIFLYLLLTGLIAAGSALLFQQLAWKWGVPFALGCVFWVGSLLLCILREKAFLFSPFALLTNALGAGFCIGAYVLGEKISFDWKILPLIAFTVSATYLLLMVFLSVPKLKQKIWYVIVSYVLWMTGSVFLCLWLCPLLLQRVGLALPPKMGMLLFFFLLLLGFLALGSVSPVDDFEELLTAIIIPALIATFFILVIVLLCLGGCDDCSCDGCEGCCDCGDCSGGQYNSTSYGKHRKTTMSEMSGSPPTWL